MSISFPKRNIAQPLDRPKEEPIREDIVYQETEQDPNVTIDTYQNLTLYPRELWRLHNDLDLYVYHFSGLSEAEQEALRARIPISVELAEQQADALLYAHVQKCTARIGADAYYQQLKSAITPQAEILLALRCLMASTTPTKIDPSTTIEITKGNTTQSYSYSTYTHTVLDKMPTNVEETMREVLKSHNIKDVTDAGLILSAQGRQASIHERIVARIAYLILNAEAHKSSRILTQLALGPAQNLKKSNDSP